MFKSKLALVVGVLAIGASTASMAATFTGSTAIQLTATIPPVEFKIGPDDTTFGGSAPVAMSYDVANGSLSDIVRRYQFKTSASAIKAYIDGGPADLSNGNPLLKVPLSTKFNNIELTATPAEVVPESTAVAGGSANLVISAGSFPTGATGDYTASYTVMFENTVP